VRIFRVEVWFKATSVDIKMILDGNVLISIRYDKMPVLWPSDLQFVMHNFLFLFFLLFLGFISGNCDRATFCMAYIEAS